MKSRAPSKPRRMPRGNQQLALLGVRDFNPEDLIAHHQQKIQPLLDTMPWILRITERTHRPPPLFILRERVSGDENGKQKRRGKEEPFESRGMLWGGPQRRCLPVLRNIVSRVTDPDGQPMELHRFLTPAASAMWRGNLPLDEEAGVKLGLIFRLHERVKEMDRVELIARRVDRFTREEAAYWLSRLSATGTDAARWAAAGLKIVLGGQAKDPGVERMLQQLRGND